MAEGPGATALEIGGDALLQVLGLAHVDDTAQPVLHQVDARGMGGTPGLGLGRKFFPVGLHFWPGPLTLLGRPVSANAFLQQHEWVAATYTPA